ncbi:laccase 1 [Cristinia sonorae]|uniref:laccase n=1 Tax=Cristinia sonorae TaxID=1940300 RepID=A0A8K0UJR1_9AGAR|nr:laccase 1 [Cristinia sonorae]
MARLHLTSTFVALAFTLGALAGIGPVTDLHITNAQVNPDGQPRDAVLAGNTFPGPLITGNKGDNFQINVIDELTEASMLKTTSIHWHGFFQHGTNWADGPAFVNQCPIASGDSFLYNFHVPDQAGTFWYHSHLSTQYCDGLRGAFVVYDPQDPHASLYDVDNDDTVITLADWYHTLARAGPKFPTADSTLINGKGRFKLGPAADLAVITVEAGKRYRFRLVNIACDPNYVFSIDNHDMTVIEVDGVNSQPLLVDSLQIFAAQRYSVVVNANQPVGNYWIRANPQPGTTGFAGGINSAILRYVGAPVADPTTTQPTSTKPLKETDLHPLENPGAPGQPVPGGVDKAFNLLFAFNGAAGEFTINGATFVPPTVPVLLQILSGAQTAQDLLPTGSVFPIPGNSVIEISMPGGVLGGPHPFHLHGHVFDVVRSAGSTVYNYDNPIRRDVVSTGGAGDNVTIRFTVRIIHIYLLHLRTDWFRLVMQTDNAGPWFLHCHIDWHLEAGFAVVFAEDIPNVASGNPVPQAWSDLCPKYNALDPSDH